MPGATTMEAVDDLDGRFLNAEYCSDTPFLRDARDDLLLSLEGHRKRIEALKQVDEPTEKEIAMVLFILIRAGLSQSDLAAALQTSKTTIGRWLEAANPNQPRPLFRKAIIMEASRILETMIARAEHRIAA